MSKAETTTDLAVVTKDNALAVFSQDKGLEPYLAKIRAEIDAFVPDASTKKGRDAIASIAHKVARSKTALDSVGKDLVAELKEMPKKVDAERKRMRDLLDAWKDEVRAPLTAWEQAEQDRVQRHQAGVEWFGLRADENQDLDCTELKASLAEVEGRVVDPSWEEFEADAHRAKSRALQSLRVTLAAREKLEAEQAELARLRAEAAARDQKEREERIAREAAEQAKREAEAAAQAEREAAIRREQEAKAAAERRELELQLRAEQAKREAETAERNRLEAAQRAESDRLAAERRHAQEVEQARKAEVERQAAEARRIEAEAKAREADKAHKTKINRAALDAFISGGMTDECAKLAVTLIAKRTIPNVAISY